MVRVIFILILTNFGFVQTVDASSPAAMTEDIYKYLQKAQFFIEKKDYTVARETLEKASKRRLTDYEKAQVLNLRAFVATQEKRYQEAVELYESLLKITDIPERLKQNTVFVLVQLSMVLKDYQKAIAHAQDLLAEKSVDPNQVSNLKAYQAQAYYQLDNFDAARGLLEDILDFNNQKKSSQARPKEQWLLLLNAIYYQQKAYKLMIRVLELLIANYPKDSYIYNLAVVYGYLEQPEKQLSLLEPLYEKGYVNTDSQLTHLAQLFIEHKLPEKAARLLRKKISDSKDFALKDQELLVQALLSSKETEQAIKPLLALTSKSPKAEHFLQLGQSYFSLGQWEKAEEALRRAVAYPAFKQGDNAMALIGICLYHQKKFELAIASFRASTKTEQLNGVSAQWIRFLEQEEAKYKLLTSET